MYRLLLSNSASPGSSGSKIIMVKFLNTFFFYLGCFILMMGMCCDDAGFMTAFMFAGGSILWILLGGKSDENIYEISGAKWLKDRFGIDIMNEE